MRTKLLVAWLLVALGGIAFHLGPGRALSKSDRTSSLLDRAYRHTLAGEYETSLKLYDEALGETPADHAINIARIRLEKSKAFLEWGAIGKAYHELLDLNRTVENSDVASRDFRDEVQATLGVSEFYGTWAMRLEGSPRAEWLPIIESARQRFRLLTERSENSDESDSHLAQVENLEIAIRLQRATDDELEAMPLPSPVRLALLGAETGSMKGTEGMGERPEMMTGSGNKPLPNDDRPGAGASGRPNIQRSGS